MDTEKRKTRPKGTAKTGGRKSGTPNRVTRAAREVIGELLDQNAPRFAAAMDEIYTTDKPLFAALYIKMLPYVTPKLNAVDIRDKTDKEKGIEQELAEMAAENQE
jgi:hypothetical protein